MRKIIGQTSIKSPQLGSNYPVTLMIIRENIRLQQPSAVGYYLLMHFAEDIQLFCFVSPIRRVIAVLPVRHHPPSNKRRLLLLYGFFCKCLCWTKTIRRFTISYWNLFIKSFCLLGYTSLLIGKLVLYCQLKAKAFEALFTARHLVARFSMRWITRQRNCNKFLWDFSTP